MTETAYRIGEGGEPLYALLYRPPAAARGTLVFCPPLFEERKSSHRALVEAARTLCRRGYAVLRFDYRGCGDSPGSFEDVSLGDWAEDTRQAMAFARQTVPGARPGLLALRLGAAPALLAAAGAAADFVILWEPVLKGAEHLDQELRKKLMKEMLTFGHSRGRRADLVARLETGETIDFDGYAVSARLHRDLCEFDASRLAGPLPATLAIQVSPREQPEGAAARWVDERTAAGCAAAYRHVAIPPFWNLIGHVDIAPLTNETLVWLERQQGENRA